MAVVGTDTNLISFTYVFLQHTAIHKKHKRFIFNQWGGAPNKLVNTTDMMECSLDFCQRNVFPEPLPDSIYYLYM